MGATIAAIGSYTLPAMEVDWKTYVPDFLQCERFFFSGFHRVSSSQLLLEYRLPKAVAEA